MQPVWKLSISGLVYFNALLVLFPWKCTSGSDLKSVNYVLQANDRSVPSSVMVYYGTTSKIACGVQCLQNKACVSFSYVVPENKCGLIGQVVAVTDLVKEVGSQAYYIMDVVPMSDITTGDATADDLETYSTKGASIAESTTETTTEAAKVETTTETTKVETTTETAKVETTTKQQR